MSEILELISDLRDRGISIWADGHELRYRKSSGPLSPREVIQLRTNKQHILSMLATMAAEERAALPPIRRIGRNGPLVLSFAQQRLWFLLQIEGASEAYHIPVGLRIMGKLDEVALCRALNRLVARHETLRTRFGTLQAEGFQRIDPSDVGFRLQRHDLSGEADAEGRLSALVIEETTTPFDLEHEPPARGRLVRIAPDEYVLLITLHHINADGWSMWVLARELSKLYGAFAGGADDPLEPIPIQYADYAAWQRRWLPGEMLTKQRDYWRGALAGVPTLLELPTDRPRPAQQRFDGKVAALELDENLTAGLKALGQRYGMTLFMTMLAGWSLVLSRLSGQDDVVIGTPTANRTRAEVEGLIGLFVNTLALRINLSGDPTVEELLLRTKTAAIEAQEHQDLPFEQVVELINPVRSPAHTPLFQVMLAWQNNEVATFDLHGLHVTQIPMPALSAKYDLTLDLAESGRGIVGILNYATALFDPKTAQRHLGYLRQALSRMITDVMQPVSAVDFLPPEERYQIVVGWNDTSVRYPQERCIHELFEEQVERTPDTVAVVCKDRCLTYAELNRRANQLARYLIDKGVGHEQLVGICVERGLEMVVGLLGILKAGGAYLPLDPAYPSERLAYMLTDAAPRVLLTQEHLKNRLPTIAAEAIALDAGWGEIAARNGANCDARALGLTSRHLAYVIYTSGSTGDPKGVMGEHRGMANRIAAQGSIAAFRDDDICCQKTSIGFVDAIFETVGPLAYGRPLVLASSAAAKDVQQLASLIERERITRLITVPSLAQALLESDRAARCLRSLRGWTLSGEELKRDLLLKLQEALPNCSFTNLYGSSEVAADATCYTSRSFEDIKVPIGRPIANTQIYILDRHLQPVPIGVAAEIYVAGAGVARGYLNRPELTASRFLPDPFSTDPQARMYKTGDLGRWRADGMLEYLGRNDDQVKIRGFRIELGEIEAHLARHELVREAAVVAREDISGGKRLVGYITSREQSPPSAEELRAHMKSVLPEHMIPGAFVILENLPLTSSGKVDRRALPAPELAAYVTGQYEAPEGEVEAGLGQVWQELLGVERIGRRDNFFELGGHSLHGVKLVAKVAERFGVRLSVAAVFQYPTIQEMAKVVNSLRSGDDGTPIQEEIARPRDSGGQIRSLVDRSDGEEIAAGRLITSATPVLAPLAFSQLAHWQSYRLNERRSLREVASVMRLRGPLSLDVLRRSFAEVVHRHDALRTRILVCNGTPMQTVDNTGDCELIVDDLTGFSETSRELEVKRLIEQFILEPIDVAVGPLHGMKLLRVRDDQHVLIVAMEHMISDAFSLKILLRELFTAYAQALQDHPISLPEIPVQLPDYAVWQRSALASWIERHGAYWSERLAGCQRLRFPEDRCLPTSARPGWGAVTLQIGRPLKAELLEWCRRRRTTLVMSVFTAYVGLVLRWCNASGAVFQYQSDGRISPKLENTIGYVASVLFLRIELQKDENFVHLLNRITDEYCKACEHADSSYLQAQIPRPEFARNSAFNWVPLGSKMKHSEGKGSRDAIKCSPILFANPMLEKLELDSEPFAQFFDMDDGITGRLNFSLSRFSIGTMERFGRNLLVFIKALLRHSEVCVKDVQLE